MKFKIPSIAKMWKIGLITASAVLTVGGATMALVGGLPTYQTTQIVIKDGAIVKVNTEPYGIGLLNFDNKTKDLVPTINGWSYDKALETASKLTKEEKDVGFAEIRAEIKKVEEDKSIPEDMREYFVDQAKSSLYFFEAFVNMPTMHSLAVSGLVLAPIFLITLIGSCIVKTKKTD